MVRALTIILCRDLHLAVRQGGDTVTILMFFVLTVILFPFGVGPEPNILARIASGVIWVTALLASMLSLERMFHADYEDGSLDLLVLSPVPPGALVLVKCLAHWLTTGLPLIIVAPVLAVLLNMDADGFAALMATMALGTPTLTLIGAIGAALTLGARKGGVLMSLLVLPLYIPVLIFGVAAIDAAVVGLGARPHLMILAGLLLGTLVLAPLAAAAALRQALE